MDEIRIAPRALDEVLHDLRTPLATSKGRAETLMKHWHTTPEPRRLELLAGVLLGLNELVFSVDRLDPSASDRPAPAGESPVVSGGSGRHTRPRLIDLELDRSEDGAAARVVLDLGGDRLQGVSRALEEEFVRHPVVARATVTALAEVLTDELELLDAGVVQLGETPLALVSLRHGAELLVGCAVAEDDLNLAIARATLDALNRLVTRPGD